MEDSVVDQYLQNGTFSQDVGISGDCLTDCSEQIKCTKSNCNIAQVGKLDANISTFPENSTLSEVPAIVQGGNSDNLLHSMGGGITNSSSADVPTVKVDNWISDSIAHDYLDHIVLRERQRMLLSRCYSFVI